MFAWSELGDGWHSEFAKSDYAVEDHGDAGEDGCVAGIIGVEIFAQDLQVSGG